MMCFARFIRSLRFINECDEDDGVENTLGGACFINIELFEAI